MRRCVWVLAVVALPVLNAWGAVWYVDKDNNSSSHDGHSWAKAYRTIQQAIDGAAGMGGGEVWVAEGVYDEARAGYPHGDGVNTGSLMLQQGVSVYGGFAGNETTRAARNWATHPTVIDGTHARAGARAYHVVVGANGAVLDGFTVQGGNANGGSSNTDARRFGGGMYNVNATFTIANCTFTNNSATIVGGAIYNFRFGGTISNCVFTANTGSSTSGLGGAIYQGGEAPTIRDCIFLSNSAQFGGAMYLDGSSPRFTNVLFNANLASWDGGGIYHVNSSGPSFSACYFIGNQADNGGALHGPASASSFVNCAFQANKASMKGGAIYLAASPAFTNCTFSANTGATGSAFFCFTGANPKILNSILWDEKTEIAGTAQVTYSCVKGGFTGTGNKSGDPRFLGVGTTPLKLRGGSPCIDAATPLGAPGVDMTGQGRPVGTGIDMGAYEGASCVLTTSMVGTGTVEPAPGTFSYFLQGAQTNVRATAAAGWRFARWEGDATGAVNPLPVTMNTDKSVRAVFLKQCTLTVQVEGAGAVSPGVGAHIYDAGTAIPCTAIAADGWRFDHWEGGLTGSQNPKQFTISGDVTVKAVFVLEYALNVSVIGNGTVSPGAGSHVYAANTVVALTATPTDGWRFQQWQGGVTGTTNPTSVTMNGNKSVTAIFEPIPIHTLTVQKVGQGEVSPTVGSHSYREGTKVNVSATPAEDWVFKNWEGDLSGTLSTTSITMNDDQTVRAVFELTPFTIANPTRALGLTVGGTEFMVNVEGWNSTCELYMGTTKCTRVTVGAKTGAGSKALSTLHVFAPPLAAGSYSVKAVKPGTGQEATATQQFTYTDNPFRTDLAEDFDTGVEIDDGNTSHTLYAVRRLPTPGKALAPIHYVSPEGITLDVPTSALPTGATSAFLMIRTGRIVTSVLSAATLPNELAGRSGIIDVHLYVPGPQGGPAAVEYLADLPQAAVLTLPSRPAVSDPEIVVGGLATTLDGLFAPVMPSPSVFADVSATYTWDDQKRAVFDIIGTGAFVLMGEGVPGDIDRNGQIDAVDVQLVVNGILGVGGSGFDYDANQDGLVNAVDLQFVINQLLNGGS